MKSNGNLYRESFSDLPQPKIIKATISDIRRERGTFSMDVIDDVGNSYRRVRMLNILGGTPDSFQITPFQLRQEVYIITMSPNDPVFCIGSVYHPSFEHVQNFVPQMTINNDVRAYSKNDFVLSNYDNSIALTPSNGVIINSDTNCRIQLGNAGKLRISQNSQCGEYVIGGTQFLVERKKYIDELDAKIVKMEEHLGHLTDTVNAILTGLLSFSNGGQAPVPSAALAGAMADAITPNTDTQTANQQLQALPKRTTVEHTSDCAKALNFNILIPKNPPSE